MLELHSEVVVLMHATDKQFSHRPERDRERKDLADSARRFDDVIKGIGARMPADPVDLLPYFRDVEQQFDLFEVAVDLTVESIRPQLSIKLNNKQEKVPPAHPSVSDLSSDN